jgi:hypothetical protein
VQQKTYERFWEDLLGFWGINVARSLEIDLRHLVLGELECLGGFIRILEVQKFGGRGF